jgi:hypothetical protein
MTGRRKAQPGSGADSGLRRVMPGRAGPGDRVRTLSIGGRVLRVAVRDGNPAWPPLLLCNGIGAPLELFQPFVDALDPQRPIVRFDMPGIGGSPTPLVNAKIMHRLILHSELHIYHGGHLALATDAHQLAPVVEAFLTAGTAGGTAAAPEQARRPRRRRVRAGGLRPRMLGRPADGAHSANALRETRSPAVDAQAAPIAREIALTALAALDYQATRSTNRSTTEVLEQHEGRPTPAGEPGQVQGVQEVLTGRNRDLSALWARASPLWGAPPQSRWARVRRVCPVLGCARPGLPPR